MKQRILILLIALDHLALVLLTLGHCKRGETISAALWSLEQDDRWIGQLLRPCVDWLFTLIEREHCRVSWLTEKYLYIKPRKTA